MFESYYKFVPQNTLLKSELLNIRYLRWEHHCGVPTLAFLITYQQELKQLTEYFDLEIVDLSLGNIFKKELLNYSVDEKNEIWVDKEAIAKIAMPLISKDSGNFLKTYNPKGGFTTVSCDSYSQQFIEHAGSIASCNGAVLEIGAGFGAASLRALAKGAVVYCNDIEPLNLAVIRNRYIEAECKSGCLSSVTGDDKRLILLPGSLSNELDQLPKNFFDAILICRVLHFFSGHEIERILRLMGGLLKSGGRIFVVCETPFLKNWQTFLPEYNKRLIDGVEWPGEINNPAHYENSGRVAALPDFVHWISKEILERAFKKLEFLKIESLSYIDRKGQFPADLLLHGEESVGVVAVRV